MHWNTFKIVDEIGARTHEKVVLQSPDIKTNYVKIFRSMCVTFHRDEYISLMHILKYNYSFYLWLTYDNITFFLPFFTLKKKYIFFIRAIETVMVV